jgi:hypothetical protein
MKFGKLVSTHLPNAVVAATIFTLYNTYTDNISDPVTIALEFFSYVTVIFIGFVVITPILNKAFGSVTT